MPKTTNARTVTVPSLTALTGQLIDSRLGAIHRGGHQPLRRALCAIPEWVQAVERLNTLEALRPPPAPAEDTAVDELAAWLEQAIEADKLPSGDDALAEAHRVKRDTEARGLLVHAFRQIAGEYATKLDQAVRWNADSIYRHLTDELRAVVTRGREVAEGFGLDAESAIRIGRVEEYQAAAQVAREYAMFRTTRNRLDAALGWADSVSYPELRWIANPADPDVFQHWRSWALDGYLVDAHNPQQRRPLSPPWPDPHDRLRPEDEAAGWLRFLVNCPAAIPWFPSPGDHRAAASQLHEYAIQLRTPPEKRSGLSDTPPIPPEWISQVEAPRTRQRRKVPA